MLLTYIKKYFCCCFKNYCDKNLLVALISAKDVAGDSNVDSGADNSAASDANADADANAVTDPGIGNYASGRVIKVINYNTFVVDVKKTKNKLDWLLKRVTNQKSNNSKNGSNSKNGANSKNGTNSKSDTCFIVKLNGFHYNVFDEFYGEYNPPETNLYSLSELARDSLISKMLGKDVELKNISFDKNGYVLADVYLHGKLLDGWMIENIYYKKTSLSPVIFKL